MENLQAYIETFANAWMEVRRKPNTHLERKPHFIKVDFGEEVAGRRKEFFVVRDSINKGDFLADQEDHWVTVIGDEDPGELVHYEQVVKEYLMYHSSIKSEDWNLFENGDNSVKRIETRTLANKLNAYFDKDFADRERLEDSSVEYYVIYDNGQLAGHGRVSFLEGRNLCCLDNIFIDSKYRRKGLAKKLCSHLLARAAEKSCSRCILGASQQGMPLYEKLGFAIISPMYVFQRKTEEEK
ncbi:GNAT family N-acetyltransferase [Sediminibacillus halophilus]|uniref:Acetyltransferase (GNAT) domain-containing protein n=1 Tax=Sediminibacillus halophilus TaxID=482461 RepID=A0A1G9V743_9BACI|nr:GNAT family N-acetyltransferase [Sediminibacillus halophilus]SDM67979.1 Acetyltransferase (GNAT) domain-containing protein [Sediminibacillus halophilus]